MSLINTNFEKQNSLKEKEPEIENLIATFDAGKFSHCIKKCKAKSNCFYETFSILRVRDSYYKSITPNAKKVILEVTNYKAFYKMDDFWLQFLRFVNVKLLVVFSKN